VTAPSPGRGAGQEAPPTCYRHPDRETYVRCTRCNRPICPDCMVAASVGFQCPDDVKQGGKGARQARTAFGGRLSPDTSRVTLALIAVNVVVFVAGYAQSGLDLRFGNLASAIATDNGTVYDGVADGAWYRLVTAAFLHAGVLHLLFNMFALAQIGPVLERALGRGRFVALYLLAALGGSTLSFLLSPPNQLGVGASGAIFGLFGAYYVVVRRLGGDTSQIVVLLVVNLVITFAVPIIDWRAHVGGLLTGAAVAAALVYSPRGPRRTLVQAAACALVLLALAVAVVLRTAALTA